MLHETDFTYLEMKCTCVNVALASKSDSCLREFLSREELFMLDTRCQEARQIQAQNAANRAAQDTENEMAQKQYESSLKQRAEQREEDYKLLIAAVEKKKREFIQECEARFHMEFTEPAKSRNHSRLLRACWKYYSEFFPSPSTIIEAGTAADDLMRNSQILKDELERQTVSNHDITACPYCRRAALNPKSLTLAIEEVFRSGRHLPCLTSSRYVRPSLPGPAPGAPHPTRARCHRRTTTSCRRRCTRIGRSALHNPGKLRWCFHWQSPEYSSRSGLQLCVGFTRHV